MADTFRRLTVLRRLSKMRRETFLRDGWVRSLKRFRLVLGVVCVTFRLLSGRETTHDKKHSLLKIYNFYHIQVNFSNSEAKLMC